MDFPNPETYLSDNYVVVDFETTNKERGSPYNPDNYCILAVYGNRVAGYSRVDFTPGGSTPQEVTAFFDALQQAEFVVAHNAKFEQGWLNRLCDEQLVSMWYDTMLGEYVIQGNRKVPLTLDALSQRYLKTTKELDVMAQIHEGVPTEDIDRGKLFEYCEVDVSNTEQIMLLQRQRLAKDGLLAVTMTRCLLVPVLAEIEAYGMCLDRDAVMSMYHETTEKVTELSRVLDEITGGINLNSPKQLGEFLYETMKFKEPTNYKGEPLRTPKGAYKTDEKTLAKIKARTREQQEFMSAYLEYSKADSRLTKYMRKLVDCCEEDGGILHATLNQINTATHRLSSTGRSRRIQFQNIERLLKVLFKARDEDYRVVEDDASQLEFRVAVYLGRDKQGMIDILDGVDVHANTQKVLAESGDVRSRTESKPETFKPLYGGTSGTPAQKKYYTFFRDRYNGVYATQRGWVNEVLRNKVLITPWGLRYYWPNTKTYPTGYVENQNSIFNYPVQGLATAEIIPIILYCVWRRLKENPHLRVLLVNTVHDSIIAEVHKDDAELYRDLVVQVFKEDVYKYLADIYGLDFDVPLGLGHKVGVHWNDPEAAEEKIEPRIPCIGS